MRPLLIIDLSKGRPKGSKNVRHKYIARILLTNGDYVRIYPNDDEGEFYPGPSVFNEATKKMEPSWLFRLAKGKSLAAIVNRHLWGGYTGEIDKLGRPKAPDGFFRTYEVVHKTQLANEKIAGKQRVDEHGNPMYAGRQKVGDYVIFEYSKVPVIGKDSEGKNRYGGYVHIDWNSTIIGKYNYKEPKELLNHRVSSESDFEAAAAQRVGDYVAEGSTLIGPVHHITDKPKSPELKNLPMTTEETQAALGITLDESTDPLTIAKVLKDKLLFNKNAKLSGKKLKIEPFPQWAVDKFGSEEKLLAHMQERPITTMITLGIAKPTKYSTKLNARLEEEWRREIVRGAARGWERQKYTDLYDKMKKLDAADGLDATDENSRVRKLRSTVSNDISQHAFERLHQVAMTYTPDKGPFHAYARVVLHNHMTNLSKQFAKEGLVHTAIVEDHNIEEAAHKNKQTAPLDTGDAAELNKVTPLALKTINRVIFGDSFPQAYRNVIMSRLNLDDAREESARLASHEATEATKRAQAEEEGKAYKRESFKMERDWEEVYHKYKPWTDPDTGKLRTDLDDKDSTTRFRWLTKWYKQGIDHIKRELSEPLPKRDPKSKKPEPVRSTVTVAARDGDYTHEEMLAHAVLGAKGEKTIKRVLTQEGEHFKRYFELKAKLAGARRIHGTSQEEIAREAYPDYAHVREEDLSLRPKPRTLPEHSTKPLAHVLLIPSPGDTHRTTNEAVGFFTAEKNKQLAQRLGLSTSKLQEQSPQRFRSKRYGEGESLWVQPNLSLGSHTQRQLAHFEEHYKQLNKYRGAADHEISKLHKQHSGAHSVLQSYGSWKQTPKGAEWKEPKGAEVTLSTLHDAALKFRSALHTVAEKEARIAKYKKEVKAAQASTGTAEDTTIGGHTMTELSESKLKLKIQSIQPTPEELALVEKTKKTYEKLTKKIGAIAPEVVSGYHHALSSGEDIGPSHLSVARAVLSQVQHKHRHQVALLDFVRDERKIVKKSDADDLIVAIYAYDFELGRLEAA